MTTENDIYTVVRRAISSPDLQRNLRGQVRAGMACLPQVAQNFLACSFVEHSLQQLHESNSPKLELALQGIEAIRSFLDGAATVHDVVSATKMLIESDITKYDTSDGGCGYNVGITGRILRSLQECCCKRELKAARLVLPGSRLKTDAAAIAQDMCYCIAHHVGGGDWDSDDKELRKAARQRGKEAMDNEAIWQLDQILECCSRLSSPQKG